MVYTYLCFIFMEDFNSTSCHATTLNEYSPSWFSSVLKQVHYKKQEQVAKQNEKKEHLKRNLSVFLLLL